MLYLTLKDQSLSDDRTIMGTTTWRLRGHIYTGALDHAQPYHPTYLTFHRHFDHRRARIAAFDRMRIGTNSCSHTTCTRARPHT